MHVKAEVGLQLDFHESQEAQESFFRRLQAAGCTVDNFTWTRVPGAGLGFLDIPDFDAFVRGLAADAAILDHLNFSQLETVS